MLFSSVAICASTAATRARRRVDLLRAGARLQPRDAFPARGARALAGRMHAAARHVPPRRRIVTLFARAGVGAEQRFEALEIRVGRSKIGVSAAAISASAACDCATAWLHVFRA